jgi:hypothetical protein
MLQQTAAESDVDGAGLDPDIEAQMAADEAAWGESNRDARGRFTSTNEAGDTGESSQDGDVARADGDDAERGTRNAERGIGEQGKAATNDNDGSEAKAKAAGKNGEAKSTATQDGETPPAKAGANEAAKGDATKGGEPPRANSSAWARENERKAKTWEGINQTKAELAAEREQLKLEREQFTAQQQQTATPRRDEAGFSAVDYERHAKRFASSAQMFTAQAMEAEGRGDFATADRLNEKAAREQQLAEAAQQQAKALGSANGPGAVWERLKADLPEALQFNGPINKELRATLRGNQALLADPLGPYRAAVLVGRKVLQETEGKLTAAQAEAAKVPGLQQKITELSARVQELQQATSLPGGGGTISRGQGSEGKAFADLSLEEMEQQLRVLGTD